MTLAIGGTGSATAETLAELARQPLPLFTAVKGGVMPNFVDQANNLKEGDRALLLSEKGLSEIAGISRIRVIDQGKAVPITAVPRLHLFLNHNEITALPEEMDALDNVVFLYCEHNRMSALPRALARMDRLEGMYFTDNRFTEIPPFVFEMTRLKKLQFSKNEISELPEAIGNLNQLRHFNMADNRVAKIPETMAKLTLLRVCDLSDNPFTELPEVFGKVQIVNQLRVRNTGLTSLPEGFATMRATIDITGSRIDPDALSPALRAHINTEKPPGSKEPDKIIVRRPEKQ
jgi:internalin A